MRGGEGGRGGREGKKKSNKIHKGTHTTPVSPRHTNTTPKQTLRPTSASKSRAIASLHSVTSSGRTTQFSAVARSILLLVFGVCAVRWAMVAEIWGRTAAVGRAMREERGWVDIVGVGWVALCWEGWMSGLEGVGRSRGGKWMVDV